MEGRNALLTSMNRSDVETVWIAFTRIRALLLLTTIWICAGLPTGGSSGFLGYALVECTPNYEGVLQMIEVLVGEPPSAPWYLLT